VIVEGDLLLELLVSDGCLPVSSTGHLKTLWIFILLDIATTLAAQLVLLVCGGCSIFSLEEGVPVGQERPVVTSPLRAVIKHFYLNKYYFT
jgi:hypothetical protein